jgi:hypothetical protein
MLPANWHGLLCSSLLDMLMKTFPSHVGHLYILHLLHDLSFNSFHVGFVSKVVHVSQ